jgi:hypothetical protein
VAARGQTSYHLTSAQRSPDTPLSLGGERMTAEIAVANKWGVALAADSAVTVEQFHKGRLREKVYNSANKLFSLSKFRPVGAMIYNTVSLAGTPWETVIKSARLKLARNECDYLQEYADFLFDFVTDNNDIYLGDIRYIYTGTRRDKKDDPHQAKKAHGLDP